MRVLIEEKVLWGSALAVPQGCTFGAYHKQLPNWDIMT